MAKWRGEQSGETSEVAAWPIFPHERFVCSTWLCKKAPTQQSHVLKFQMKSICKSLYS